MYALIQKSDNELLAIVSSLDGYDMSLYTIREDIPANHTDWVWSKGTSSWVPRTPTDSEATRAALLQDQRWAALRNASGAQIDAWLESNVTNLAQARQVLGLLLRAVRVLAADGKFN